MREVTVILTGRSAMKTRLVGASVASLLLAVVWACSESQTPVSPGEDLTIPPASMGSGVSGQDLFDFRSMAAVPASPPTIRGIAGGGVPWAIDRARARLTEDGRLRVRVRGLVVAATGVNPVGSFGVTLSCEGTSAAIGPAAATPEGDAEIRGMVALSSCLAPIVLVRVGANGPWLAVSGF